MRDFMRMLAESHGDDETSTCSKADPAAVVMDLREAAALYATSVASCPYKIGDIVTPRQHFTVKGAGEPHIVVDMVADVSPLFDSGEPGSNAWGKRIDMRIIQMSNGNRVSHWVESFEFELYADAVKRKADAAAAQAASIATPTAADPDFEEVAA